MLSQCVHHTPSIQLSSLSLSLQSLSQLAQGGPAGWVAFEEGGRGMETDGVTALMID